MNLEQGKDFISYNSEDYSADEVLNCLKRNFEGIADVEQFSETNHLLVFRFRKTGEELPPTKRLVLLPGIENSASGQFPIQIARLVSENPELEILSVHYSYDNPLNVDLVLKDLDSLISGNSYFAGVCIGANLVAELIFRNPNLNISGAYLFSPFSVTTNSIFNSKIGKIANRIAQKPIHRSKVLWEVIFPGNQKTPTGMQNLQNIFDYSSSFQFLGSPSQPTSSQISIFLSWAEEENFFNKNGKAEYEKIFKSVFPNIAVKKDLPGKHGLVRDNADAYTERLVSFLKA